MKGSVAIDGGLGHPGVAHPGGGCSVGPDRRCRVLLDAVEGGRRVVRRRSDVVFPVEPDGIADGQEGGKCGRDPSRLQPVLDGETGNSLKVSYVARDHNQAAR